MADDTSLKNSETVYGNLSESLATLNKLSDIIYRDDIDIDDLEDYEDRINTILNSVKGINSIVDDIKDDLNIDTDDAEDVQLSSDYKYSIGETCLLLDPFDNYRIFSLYDSQDTNSKPLDLSDGQKLYLVFKQGSKEIRIPEYEIDSSYISIDKKNGQVLFKITKKQATDIMNLKNNSFYITRIYETYNSMTDSIISSDEEVLFSGYWADRNSEKETNLRETIDGLKSLLEQRDTAMQSMVDSINKLVEENTKLAEQVEELKKYQETVDDLVDKGIIDSDGQTTPLIGEILDSKTVIIDYNNDNISDETKTIIDDITNNGTILKGSKNFLRT